MTVIDGKQKMRHINSIRFAWFEKVNRDRYITSSGATLALAGYVKERFNPRLGYAEFATRWAAEDLDYADRTMKNARKRLIERGWIRELESPGPDRSRFRAKRYILTGGPDDLSLDAHQPNEEIEGDETDTTQG